ncbi:PRC-barrel domain-containing protein [Alkalicoccobacillus gibsonii]|uniref:PRC-barrel domain-containing protein n=1 Tax=Alkalicoccobacillus gibsonii TaxID=79881 RepID=UPI0035150A5A
MRTFAFVEGLPVIEMEQGTECGRVIDILISNNRITGLLINMRGWFNRHRFLLLEHVSSIGDQAIMIRTKEVIKTCQPGKTGDTPLALGRCKLKGMELFSQSGAMLGLIEDVYFSVEMGTIVGYKVTDGLLADLTTGQKMYRCQHLVVGKERAILSN